MRLRLRLRLMLILSMRLGFKLSMSMSMRLSMMHVLQMAQVKCGRERICKRVTHSRKEA
jgi:hypothetical protein